MTEAAIAVGLVAFLIAGLLNSPLPDIFLDACDDLKNRNDRGLPRKPSSEHVL